MEKRSSVRARDKLKKTIKLLEYKMR